MIITSFQRGVKSTQHKMHSKTPPVMSVPITIIPYWLSEEWRKHDMTFISWEVSAEGKIT